MTIKDQFFISFIFSLSITTQACGADHAKDAMSCSAEFTPSGLLKAGVKCEGQRVVVQGVLRDGDEMHGLWDSVRDIDFSNYGKKCITTYNPKGLEINGPVRKVKIYGTFRTEWPEGIVILGSCSDAVLEIEKVDDLR